MRLTLSQGLTLPAGEARQDMTPWLLGLAGLCILYLPTFYELLSTVWASDEQGHGPIVLAISVWLIWRNRQGLTTWEGARPRPVLALVIAGLGACIYVVGRTQDILLLEVGSLIWMVVALVLLLRGVRQLAAIWFALFFMLFLIPLPSSLVDALTQPMKMAVSHAATGLLYVLGYPVGRSGVIIYIGQYQLLVADACAGLHTLFTLEALSLLYLNVVRSDSLTRNIAIAGLAIPVSFTANIIRVIILALITYYFGDAVGQGFMHGFAGMVLFLTALMLIVAIDGVITWLIGRKRP